MSTAASSPDDAVVEAFIESTRNLAGLLEEPDVTKLTLGMQRQLHSFEALRSAIAMGALLDSAALGDAIDEGQRTLAATRRRTNEVREDLGSLRIARTGASRSRAANATAHFVSQRV